MSVCFCRLRKSRCLRYALVASGFRPSRYWAGRNDHADDEFFCFCLAAGSTTSCVKERDSPSNFTITANVTDTLNTCDPWGITVSGGVPPYMFTLAAVGSPVLTNVTSETDDQDTLTYINRADPDGQLLGGILRYSSPRNSVRESEPFR